MRMIVVCRAADGRNHIPLIAAMPTVSVCCSCIHLYAFQCVKPFVSVHCRAVLQVRIFIKFDRAEAATHALVDLQGRFFAGRQVGRGPGKCAFEVQEGCHGDSVLSKGKC
jgi:hypothetical protein